MYVNTYRINFKTLNAKLINGESDDTNVAPCVVTVENYSLLANFCRYMYKTKQTNDLLAVRPKTLLVLVKSQSLYVST